MHIEGPLQTGGITTLFTPECFQQFMHCIKMNFKMALLTGGITTLCTLEWFQQFVHYINMQLVRAFLVGRKAKLYAFEGFQQFMYCINMSLKMALLTGRITTLRTEIHSFSPYRQTLAMLPMSKIWSQCRPVPWQEKVCSMLRSPQGWELHN